MRILLLFVVAHLVLGPQAPPAPATISGRVVDGVTGAPVAGARVTLMAPPPAGQADAVHASADGAFMFAGVRPGTWTVGATASGYQGTAAVGRVAMQAGPGSTFTNVVIRMRPQGVVEGTVRTAAGEPVVGAQVLSARWIGRGRYAAGPRVTTDDRGMYRMSILADGRYVVFVQTSAAPIPADPFGREGLTPQTTHLHPTAITHPIEIGGGKTVPTMDFTIAAERGVSVSGRVTGPVASRMVGAEVLLRKADDPLPLAADAPRAVVQRDGTFTFSAVPAGAYTLSALRAGGQSTPDQSTTIEQPLVVGEHAVTDVAALAVAGTPVTGRIVFEGNSPRPAVTGPNRFTVSMQPVDRRESVFLDSRITADDTFVTRELPVGWSYHVHAFAGDSWRFKHAMYRGRDLSVDPIRIDEPLTEPIVVTMTDKAPVLVGTVRNEQGQGVAASVMVFPVDRTAWADSRINRRLQSVLSDLSGTFRFDRVPAGEYFLVSSATLERDGWNDIPTLVELSQRAVKVVLRDGETTTADVREHTDRLPEDDDRIRGPVVFADIPVQSMVTGVVQTTDAVPQPVAGAVVRLHRRADGAVWSMFSDAQGTFAFVDVGAGTFEVVAEKPAFLAGAYGRVHPSLPSRPLHLSEGQSRTVVVPLVRGGVIAGVVRGAEGRPVWGAVVKAVRLRNTADGGARLEPTGQQAAMFTDEQGRYRIFGLPPGRYTVVATPMQLTAVSAARLPGDSDPGGPVWLHSETYFPSGRSFAESGRIDLAPGAVYDSADVALTFSRSSSIDIQILMPDGTRPPAAPRTTITLSGDPTWDTYVTTIPLRGDAQAPVASTFLAPLDRPLRITMLPPGTYTIRSTVTAGADVWSGMLDVRVNDVHVSDLTMRLEPAARVTVNVQTSGDGPVPNGARVILRPDYPGAPVQMTQHPLSRTGEPVVMRVPAGPYRVSMEGLPHGWYVDSPSRVVAGVDEGVVDLVLSRTPSRLEGRTTAPTRDGTGLYVFALPSEEADWHWTSGRLHITAVDDEGGFRFEHLPPGTYSIRVLTAEQALAALEQRGAPLASIGGAGIPVSVVRGQTTTLRLIAQF